MNFYVPDPRLDARAGELLRLMKDVLGERGRAFSGRRIRALIWDDGEAEEETILVGADYRDCQAAGDPVLLILEDAADPALIAACPGERRDRHHAAGGLRGDAAHGPARSAVAGGGF